MDDPLHFDSASKRRLRENLVRWYSAHARDLPWRRTRDAYAVWISEIMLQQTTVAAVIPYYERFMARFPHVGELSRAPEEDVLRLWEGLGYYSRARNIHRAAGKIVEEHGGRFPEDVAKLAALPGIGRYTAGAIASFAYDIAAPIVEANTQRLYCRLMGYRGDPKSTAGQRLLWEFAESFVPRRQAGRFNQALMELGSTVCTPVAPSCEVCPVKRCCRAFAENAQAEIPQKARRPTVTAVTEGTVAVAHAGRFLLYRRPEGERWAGLWDFPRFALQADCADLTVGGRPSSELPARLRSEMERQLRRQFGLEARLNSLVTEIRHSVTRYRIRLLCFDAVCEQPPENGGPLAEGNVETAWVGPRGFDEFPLSMTGRKLAKLLADVGK